MEADLVYYRRRSAEEKAAAAAALHPRARAVHLELARRYEERIGELADERSYEHLHLIPAA
ncbi:MAG: hypothetical protein ACJ8FO_02305 [Sphingomicrobium sp.]